MSIGLLFWILILLWLILGIMRAGNDWKAHIPNTILFILLVLLGWMVFGPALHK